MTQAEIEKRRKIAKYIGIGLPAAGLILPWILFKGKDSKIMFSIIGFIGGLILAAPTIMIIAPGPDVKPDSKKK